MSLRHCLIAAIVLIALVPARAQEPATGDISALLQEYQTREKTYREAGDKSDPRQHPAVEFLPRFKELADKYAGQTAALPALTWILDQASRPTIPDARSETLWVVERLTRAHAAQPEIAAALTGVSRTAWRLEPEPVNALYDAVSSKNKDRAVLAQAAFQKAVFMAECSEKAPNPKPLRQEALQRLRDLKKTYKDSPYAKQADGWIFELANLQVGMKAPDIVGVDLDGKALKLSDFRGRVVVIEFWATWNKPGHDALLRERDLMSMFSDQPLTVLGINADQNRKEVLTFLSENKINFPSIYDGPGGPIVKEWNVRGWPTRYVLDHKGIIRYRHINEQQLDEAVRELLKKAPQSKDKPARKP